MNYVATKLKRSLSVDSIISIHYFEYTPNFKYAGESHDFWELIYCDNGTLSICADNRELILHHGDIFIHPPKQYHNVRVVGGKAANSIIVSFNSNTPELYEVSEKILKTDSFIASALFAVLSEAKLTFSNELGMLHDRQLIRKQDNTYFATEQAIQNYVELLLIHIIRQKTPSARFPQAPSQSSKNFMLEEILHYMKENISQKITFSDLTKKFAVSPTTLKNLFSKNFGHGAMEHLMRIRIEHAKELLRSGELSCTEIAMRCGFCSVHHFSGVFRKYEACSPTEYIRTIKSLLDGAPSITIKS